MADLTGMAVFAGMAVWQAWLFGRHGYLTGMAVFAGMADLTGMTVLTGMAVFAGMAVWQTAGWHG